MGWENSLSRLRRAIGISVDLPSAKRRRPLFPHIRQVRSHLQEIYQLAYHGESEANNQDTDYNRPYARVGRKVEQFKRSSWLTVSISMIAGISVNGMSRRKWRSVECGHQGGLY